MRSALALVVLASIFVGGVVRAQPRPDPAALTALAAEERAEAAQLYAQAASYRHKGGLAMIAGGAPIATGTLLYAGLGIALSGGTAVLVYGAAGVALAGGTLYRYWLAKKATARADALLADADFLSREAEALKKVPPPAAVPATTHGSTFLSDLVAVVQAELALHALAQQGAQPLRRADTQGRALPIPPGAVPGGGQTR